MPPCGASFVQGEGNMKSRIVFLSENFFAAFPNPPFSEIEQKHDRPYIAFVVKIEGHSWAIPFRSNIKHKNAFFTDAAKGCGIDYSKAVLVDNSNFIDEKRKAWLRQSEFEAIRGKDFEIYQGFKRYIKMYKKALKSGHVRYSHLLKFSTLQYFEDAL
jgi:protein AbiQ